MAFGQDFSVNSSDFASDDERPGYYKFACYLIKKYSKQIIDIC